MSQLDGSPDLWSSEDNTDQNMDKREYSPWNISLLENKILRKSREWIPGP